MSLSKKRYPLLSTGSAQKKSQHDLKIVDWDVHVNNEHKQVKKCYNPRYADTGSSRPNIIFAQDSSPIKKFVD